MSRSLYQIPHDTAVSALGLEMESLLTNKMKGVMTWIECCCAEARLTGQGFALVRPWNEFPSPENSYTYAIHAVYFGPGCPRLPDWEVYVEPREVRDGADIRDR